MCNHLSPTKKCKTNCRLLGKKFDENYNENDGTFTILDRNTDDYRQCADLAQTVICIDKTIWFDKIALTIVMMVKAHGNCAFLRTVF